MMTILRSLDWSNSDNAGFITTAYEISRNDETGEGILRTVCRRDNGSGDETAISAEALQGLLEAYDSNQMDQWIYDNAEGMYNGFVK